jgi:hypothetical protein
MIIGAIIPETSPHPFSFPCPRSGGTAGREAREARVVYTVSALWANSFRYFTNSVCAIGPG